MPPMSRPDFKTRFLKGSHRIVTPKLKLNSIVQQPFIYGPTRRWLLEAWLALTTGYEVSKAIYSMVVEAGSC